MSRSWVHVSSGAVNAPLRCSECTASAPLRCSECTARTRVYVLRVGDRELALTAEELIAYARRLWIERELGLPPGTLKEERW